MASKHREAGTPARRKRAPPYLARQMSRVKTRTPGVTDVQLPDLFGSGVGAIVAVSRVNTPAMGIQLYSNGHIVFTQVQAIAR